MALAVLLLVSVAVPAMCRRCSPASPRLLAAGRRCRSATSACAQSRRIKGYDCKRIAENHLGDRFGDERGLSVNNSRIQWGKIAQVQNDSIYKEPCARCGKETVYWTRSNVDEQIVCRACDQAERCIQEPTFEAVELPAEELSEYERGYEQGYDDARYTDD